jgi:hypothetical protein
MQPTDDDIRAETERILMALRADLDAALSGPQPSREDAREVARRSSCAWLLSAGGGCAAFSPPDFPS